MDAVLEEGKILKIPDFVEICCAGVTNHCASSIIR